MKRLFAIVGLVWIVACTPVRPPNPLPTPTPIPPSTGPVDGQMLLRRSGVAIVTQNGTPFDFRGEKDCCFTEVGEPEPMWPLGSHERNVWLKNQGAINFLGNRLGPWRAIPGDQPSILSLGGGYLEVNGKADLTQWNKKFWDYNDQLASDSASLGQYVEVGVYDGWAAKGHCFAGGNAPYHPFLPENNVQSEDHCNFLFDAVQETWIRKVVQVMGRHGNVTWETCNECSLAGGWNTAWEEKVIATIKDEETKRGYPQHIVATNAQTTVLSADWDEFHNEGSPQHGTDKITGVNEYNPEPPMLGAKVVDNYCAARDSGTYFWLWRHDMPLKEFEIALLGVKNGCSKIGCSITTAPVPEIAFKGNAESPPRGTRPGTGLQIHGRNSFTDEAEAAVKAAHPELFNENGCLAGWPSDGTQQAAFAAPYLTLLSDYFRSKAACASAWEDSVAWGWKGDGFFEEWHVLSFNKGCPIDGQHAWQYTWQFQQ